MRLRRFDLIRYGKFTDQQLDFGPQMGGEPDFHIIFGANEAGKSTIAQAWLDLLFGIPDRSSMGFFHANLRIAAQLEFAGNPVELARIKGRQGSLLGAGDLVVPEATLLAHLPMKDPESHKAMFWLDDETIEKGGDSILASKGELGEMLFSSTAGLTGLSARLTELREDSEKFYRKQARNTQLADFKTQLESLDEKRRLIDVQASDYARLCQVEASALEEWRKADGEAQRLRAELGAAERRFAAAPAQRRLFVCRAQIAALGDFQPPPKGWPERVPELETKIGQWQAQLSTLTEQSRTFAAEAEAIIPDPAVWSEIGRYDEVESLYSAHAEAVKDLPTRRDAATTMWLEINHLAALLGRSNHPPQDTCLPPGKLEAIRKLFSARSGLVGGCETAAAEARAAEIALQEAVSAADDLGGKPAAPSLIPLLQRLRAAAPAAAVLQAERELRRAGLDLQRSLGALAPWTGTLNDLRALTAPSSEDLQNWLHREAWAQKSRETAETEATRASKAIVLLDAGLSAGESRRNVTNADLVSARSDRENLWSAHKATLTSKTAEAFEKALRTEDELRALRASEMAQNAQLESMRATRASLGAEHQAATEARKAAEVALAELLQLAAESVGFAPVSISALRDWLAHRNEALLAASEVDRAAAELDLANTGLERAKAALAALLSIDATLPFDVIWAEADLRADQTIRLSAALERLTKAREAVDRRNGEAAMAEQALSSWRKSLTDMTTGTWLAQTDPDGLGDILGMLGEFGSLVASAEDLDRRIAKMEANKIAFDTALAGLADALECPGASWRQLQERRRSAEMGAARAEHITAARNAARTEIDQLSRRIEVAQSELTEMAAQLGLSDIAALQDHLEKAARRQALGVERDRLEADIRTALGLADLDLAMHDPDESGAPDLSQLRTSAEVQAAVAQQAFAALSTARATRSAVGSEDDVARLDVARMTVLLELAEAAERHLKQRFGILAVDQALRAFRDGHRGPMMEAAGDAFGKITRGAYRHLTTQPEKDREVLVAITRDGRSKMAASLSKGTRFQLYLALRIAAYREMAGRGISMPPFWADDILETFDEGRSGAALEQFAEMAMRGQVIYLTHHQHVVDLARRHCPGVQIHRLAESISPP